MLGAGDQLPVLGWLADWLPGFGAMRYPSRYGLLAAFACLLAGAIAVSRLSSTPWRRARWLAAALQLVLVAFAAVHLSMRYHTPTAGYWDSELRDDLARHGLFPPNGVPPRIAFDASRVRANSGLVEGYSTLDGFNNPMLRNVWESVHREAGLPFPSFDFQQLNPEIYLAGPFPVPSAALIAGWDPRRQATVFRAPLDASPRAWISSPQAAALLPAQILPGSTVTLSRFTRNTIELAARSPAPAVLILAEPAYPGWRVTVNGRDEPAQPINSWMRGTALQAGESNVRFHFRPRWLLPGAILSLLGLGTTLLLWRIGRAPATA